LFPPEPLSVKLLTFWGGIRTSQLTFFVVKFPTSQKEVLASSLGILVLLLSPLSVIDENDDDVNDDHVPSMIIAVEDLVGASLKFPAVPSADAEEKGTTTATTAPTAQTPCDDDDDRFYTTICYNPQLTSFGAYLCPQPSNNQPQQRVGEDNNVADGG
jgi:hypothetical protein